MESLGDLPQVSAFAKRPTVMVNVSGRTVILTFGGHPDGVMEHC